MCYLRYISLLWTIASAGIDLCVLQLVLALESNLRQRVTHVTAVRVQIAVRHKRLLRDYLDYNHQA